MRTILVAGIKKSRVKVKLLVAAINETGVELQLSAIQTENLRSDYVNEKCAHDARQTGICVPYTIGLDRGPQPASVDSSFQTGLADIQDIEGHPLRSNNLYALASKLTSHGNNYSFKCGTIVKFENIEKEAMIVQVKPPQGLLVHVVAGARRLNIYPTQFRKHPSLSIGVGGCCASSAATYYDHEFVFESQTKAGE
jgi:hypothetical protein